MSRADSWRYTQEIIPVTSRIALISWAEHTTPANPTFLLVVRSFELTQSTINQHAVVHAEFFSSIEVSWVIANNFAGSTPASLAPSSKTG